MASEQPATLDQLRQLPLPEPVSYWPQTWGWLALLLLVLALVALVAWHVVRTRRRNAYRREGLRRLNEIERAAQADPLAARELPVLLKRVGLSSVAQGARARVGTLTGQEWQAFLARGANVFPPDAADLLSALAYASPQAVRAIAPARLQQLFAASRQWMEQHHVAA